MTLSFSFATLMIGNKSHPKTKMNTLCTQAYFLWQGFNVTIQQYNRCYYYRVYYEEKQVIWYWNLRAFRIANNTFYKISPMNRIMAPMHEELVFVNVILWAIMCFEILNHMFTFAFRVSSKEIIVLDRQVSSCSCQSFEVTSHIGSDS